eukprot:419335-Rhodomonas_salina.2
MALGRVVLRLRMAQVEAQRHARRHYHPTRTNPPISSYGCPTRSPVLTYNPPISSYAYPTRSPARVPIVKFKYMTGSGEQAVHMRCRVLGRAIMAMHGTEACYNGGASWTVTCASITCSPASTPVPALPPDSLSPYECAT